MTFVYLTDRYQKVKTGKTTTEWLLVLQGGVQGSVIGPILFILYIYDINKYIPDEAQLKKYVDGILLANLLGNYDRTLPQRIADGVFKWCFDNQMSLNTNKCKIISVLPKNSGSSNSHFARTNTRINQLLQISLHPPNQQPQLGLNGIEFKK